MSGFSTRRAGRSRGLPPVMIATVIVGAGQASAAQTRADTLDAGGAAVVRAAEAVRTSSPVVLDGRLDEAAWLSAPVIRDFTQIEPRAGAAALLGTEVRVLYDDRYLYVGAFMRDPAGSEGVRVPDLRRNWDYFQSDLFGITLDGFGDRRTSMAFQVNPRGALRDSRVIDGVFFDREWEGLWEARTVVSDSGWSAEMRIPWTTLRYLPGARDWHVNFVRRVRRDDELSGWAPWPRDRNPYSMQYAGVLRGLEPPPPGRNVRVQPYAASRAGRIGEQRFGGDARLDVGGDAKWAFAPNAVLDATVNTDFAEADVDRQVLNLSRFSVFFPEQRAFFLENAALFRVGGERVLEPFFSRRIGLDATGSPLPIDGGIRITSQTPARSAGALAIRQRGVGATPGAWFGVARAQQNLGDRNYLGGLAVSRFDDALDGRAARSNHVFAVDGYVRPTPRSWVRSMVSTSTTSGAPSGWSAFTHAALQGPGGYAGWIQTLISEDYDASTGFVARRDLVSSSPAANLDLRPVWLPGFVRSFRPGFVGFFYHRFSNGAFQEGSLTLRPLNFTFRDASELTIWTSPTWQRLEQPFRPIPGLELEAGAYDYLESGITYKPDLSKPYWAYVTLAAGGFYDGRRERVVYRASPLPGPRLALTFDYIGERFRGIGNAGDDVVTHLAGVELRAALNPRLQLVSAYQQNSAFGTRSWNTRLAWEYRPLSYVYLVFNDGQPVAGGAAGAAAPRQQQLIVKASWIAQL
jgi:hypothetical protein